MASLNELEVARPQYANPWKKRTGLIALKAGSIVEYPIPSRLRLRSGRWLEKGTKVHLEVKHLDQYQDLAHGWHCRRTDLSAGKTPYQPCEHMADHPKGFASKKELLAAHRENRLLRADEETHLFFAVAEVPAVAKRDAKVDPKTGLEIEGAVDAADAYVLVLSDEDYTP